MLRRRQHEARLIERYWSTRAAGGTPTEMLDPSLAALIERLSADVQLPDPPADFVEQLRRQLLAQAGAPAERGPGDPDGSDWMRRSTMQFLNRDGVRLAYEQRGSGSPPLLLVHGWCCDHSYFAPQAEHFSQQHRVISVDLRGHGESDKPEQDYTMAGFADDLAWLCEQLDVARPVVVGHSMGGVIAFELAARHPDLVGAVVAVDSPLVPPAALASQIPVFVEGLRSPAYQDVARGFVGNVLFLPTDDAERKARIVEHMASAPQHVMASAMDCIFNCDTAASAAGCTAPALFINAAFPLADLDRLRELCPHVVVGQTVGAGHFNHLEVPEQVNAMIERFLLVSL